MRRTIAGIAGWAVLGIAASVWAADRPNIVFIMVDDLGYGGLSCYGQKKVPTPNVDRLAEQGTRFTDFYAGSTVCAPARCSLMTGLHQGHAYVRGNARVPLPPKEVTVAEVLKGAGYATGLVGKWGLGEPDTTGIPNRQGFDYFFGYLNQGHAHNYYPTYLWRNTERVELAGNLNNSRKQYSHDLFTGEALRFVRTNMDRPFFLYLAYTIPHANNELCRETKDGMEVPDYGSYAKRDDWTNPQKGYGGMVERMDRDIGRLMKTIDDLGLGEKTVVFFTSDNGPHKEGGFDPEFFDCNGPLRGLKRDLYEGGIRVPMLVRWPGKVPAGAVSGQIWAMWDFLPTAAAIAGVDAPKGIDGISMLPALQGKAQRQQHESMYWEFHEGGFFQAARMGQWKAVRKNGGPLELYDLSSDLGEQHDVASAHADIVEKIETYLKTARTESGHWPVKAKAKK